MSLVYAPTTATTAPFQALQDRILIRPDEEEKQSSIIWLPPDVHKRYRTGVIVSMGEGMKVNGRGFVRYGRQVKKWKGQVDELGYNLWAMPRVKVGDRVLYLIWSTHIIKVNDVAHHLVRDTEIELIFNKKEETDARTQTTATS